MATTAEVETDLQPAGTDQAAGILRHGQAGLDHAGGDGKKSIAEIGPANGGGARRFVSFLVMIFPTKRQFQIDMMLFSFV